MYNSIIVQEYCNFLDNALSTVNRIGSGMSGSNGESSICDWNCEHQYHLKENQIGAKNVPRFYIIYTFFCFCKKIHFDSLVQKKKKRGKNRLIIGTNGREIGN